MVAGTGSLDVHFASTLGTKLDVATLTAQVLGKTPVEVKEALLANPAIDSVSLTTTPFWVKSVPRWASHVDVQTKLDAPNGSNPEN